MTGRKHVLLSVVIVVDQWIDQVTDIVRRTAIDIAGHVTDYELILVDNGSEGRSSAIYRALTCEAGEPNLQVYRLSRRVDRDAAAWVGVENSLGDLVLVYDPFDDSLTPLGPALDRLYAEQADLVTIVNATIRGETPAARYGRRLFHPVFRMVSGMNLRTHGSPYRLMSKRLVSHLLHHQVAIGQYRTAPAVAGFGRVVLRYCAPRQPNPAASIAADARRAIGLLGRGGIGHGRFVAWSALVLGAANVAVTLAYRSDAAAVLAAATLLILALFGVLVAEHLLGSGAGATPHVVEEWSSAVLTRRDRFDIDRQVAGDPVTGGAQ